MADIADDAKLRALLQEKGFDWEAQRQRFQARPEQAGGASSYPTTVDVMNAGTALGIIWDKVPWATIGLYLMCVFKGIWTKPLPKAAADCAMDMGLIPKV